MNIQNGIGGAQRKRINSNLSNYIDLIQESEWTFRHSLRPNSIITSTSDVEVLSTLL